MNLEQYMYHSNLIWEVQVPTITNEFECSPDCAQEVTENIFCNVLDANFYIDNAGAFSDNWEDHVVLLHKVCGRLLDNGFTVSPFC